MKLPGELETALENELKGAGLKTMGNAFGSLSARYRGEFTDGQTFPALSESEVMAYAAYRLPATFSAVGTALAEAKTRRIGPPPTSLLDVGAGPGTASWAATEIFLQIRSITLLDRDSGMISLGQSLAKSSPAAALRGGQWRTVNLCHRWQIGSADLTIAAYTLGEIGPDQFRSVVSQLWSSTVDTCVIVEPGTPRGFHTVREAATILGSLGAFVIAPFPREWNCVQGPDDWCHFSTRVARSRLHRITKGATLAHEDEKFSYIAASRVPGQPVAARVVRHPQVRKGHLRLVVCTAHGIRELVISRKDSSAYRRAKGLAWGSAIEIEEAEMFGLQ